MAAMFVFQTNTVRVELFSNVNAFFLLQLICIAAGHVIENALLTTGLQKYKLLFQLLLGLTEIFMVFSFDLFPWPWLGFHAI